MDVSLYLKRIGYSKPVKVTSSALTQLQLAHLKSIPFENLDIHRNQTLRLDLNHIYHKVVMQNRGGICYELNGLFAWLLVELGFKVTLLSAQDAHQDGTLKWMNIITCGSIVIMAFGRSNIVLL